MRYRNHRHIGVVCYSLYAGWLRIQIVEFRMCIFRDSKLPKNFHTGNGVSEFQIFVMPEQGIVKVLQVMVGHAVQYTEPKLSNSASNYIF